MDFKEPHPWSDFLTARAKAILWLKERWNYDDEVIAKTLSMDEKQVNLIRTLYHFYQGENENNLHQRKHYE